MESKAKSLGPPVHPMLIVFPLGLLATAVAFDIGGNHSAAAGSRLIAAVEHQSAAPRLMQLFLELAFPQVATQGLLALLRVYLQRHRHASMSDLLPKVQPRENLLLRKDVAALLCAHKEDFPSWKPLR